MENRVVVYTSNNESSAIIVRDRLRSEGINTLILNVKDHVTEVVGGYEVHVHPEDEDRAKAIVAQSAE